MKDSLNKAKIALTKQRLVFNKGKITNSQKNVK